MTEATIQEVPNIPLTGHVPQHEGLVSWVNKVAALTRPARIHYCDGSPEEYQKLIDVLVESGTAVRLDESKKPNSIWVASDPDDVARVEDQTFICSVKESDAGPTNNWMDPVEMKRIMTGLYEGAMAGRTMYVIPFCMGPLDADHPKFGVELSDSAYVAASMRIMTRMGDAAVAEMIKRKADFVPCLHSVGLPLSPGIMDVPWPCNEVKYICHFPETREIWSYGSGYGGNALLGKKCYSLRIATAMARDEGWLAEHMLILKLTNPQGKVYNVCAAFPSACGKTNMAMLSPTLPGWKAETLGDDIAWLRFGKDGRLYATNPENGFFGVAPGTGMDTNPNAMLTVEKGNSIFTNVALTDDGDVWWEGMSEPPAELTDWRRRRWSPVTGPEGGRPDEKAAHPNSRFCTPVDQCPILAPEIDEPNGVPIDVIIFGGRRQNTIPLVNEARSWRHGVFLGATCSSETTAAAKGAVGVLRRDPMAMLPFIGYNATDYFQHWLDIGAKAPDPAKLPRIFYVNWFRKDGRGNFLWPGFGENLRVLKWITQRLEGVVDAVESPIGGLARPEDIDIDGLDIDQHSLIGVTSYLDHEWVDELPRIANWFYSLGEDDLPLQLLAEFGGLSTKVGHVAEQSRLAMARWDAKIEAAAAAAAAAEAADLWTTEGGADSMRPWT